MLAELAAANAAFGVIKSFVSNGKDLASCGKQISDFVFAKENIEKETSFLLGRDKGEGVKQARLKVLQDQFERWILTPTNSAFDSASVFLTDKLTLDTPGCFKQ